MPSISIKDEIFRKLIHISSLWMVVFILVFEQNISIIFFSVLLILFTGFEYLRMESQWVSGLINRYFSKIMRPNEITDGFKLSGLTGSFYFLLSIVLSLFLFEKETAIMGITIMILADTAAALIGKKFGRMRIWGKSLEGAAAFFLTTFAILICGIATLPVLIPVMIALVLTAVEFVSNRFRINDNLSITLVAGFLIELSEHIWPILPF